MKKNLYVFAILSLLILSACGGPAADNGNGSSSTANETIVEETQGEQPTVENSSGSSGNCDNKYYPVISGTSWSYAMNSSLTGEDSFIRSILDVNDSGFTDQDTWAAGTVRTGSWSCENGNLTALSLGGLATVSTSEQNFVATSQESSGVTYPSPLNTGTNWSQHLVISGDMVIAEGMNGSATADATQSCTAVGEESVTVSAGTFAAMKFNCNTTISVTVDIEGMTIDPMTITSTSEVWLASGVGMVKTVDKNDLTKTTIELTSYSIP